MDEANESKGLLDVISQNLLLVVIFLLPIIALPAVWISLPLTKMALVAIGTMVALFVWAVTRLLRHEISFPNTHVLWAGILLVIGYALAALLSTDVVRSFVGFGLERDTVLAIAVFVGLMVAVMLIFDTGKALVRLQKVILGSFLVLAILQVARITFGAGNIFPSIFSADPTANLLGSWNDLAVFSGVILLGTLSAFAFKKLSILKRGILTLALILALFLLVVVNLASAWAALAILTFILALYIFSHASYDQESGAFKARLPLKKIAPTVVVFAISVLFLIAGSALGNRVSRAFNVASIDVRPSWEGTIEVGTSVYKDTLLFGTGPNTFERAWAQNKPLGVNQTNFWNVDFNFGIGVIPTAFITGGLIVGLLWILFFVAFARLGLKVLAARMRDRKFHHLTISSFLLATYLWVLSIIYVPQTAVFALAFVFTGATLAAATLSGVIRKRNVKASDGPVQGFAVMGVLLVVIIATTTLVVLEVSRVLVANKLTRAVQVANTGDLERAEKMLENTGVLGDHARGHAARATVGVLRLREILNAENVEDVDLQRALFQEQLQKTIGAAQAATSADPEDYRNWVLLAGIYGQLVPLNIEGAYENAISAYAEARLRNPTNPSLPIELARLAITADDEESARAFIQEALALKSNYTDAYFLLSQIEISAGNTQNAISNTEAAVILSPNNPGLLFQLGILQYSENDLEKAAEVFERATALNPDYANALYFLGLTYDRLDRKEEALRAFNNVLRLNSDNIEVAAIVGSLETGGSAFDVLGNAAVDVEGQESLPISETIPVESAETIE